MGFGPLSVILWDKNDKIAFQRNRPKIMEIEKIFVFQKYQKLVTDAPPDLPNGFKHSLGHREPILDKVEKKEKFRAFSTFVKMYKF